jgi:tetratricopeptide (TPR) repeat protein
MKALVGILLYLTAASVSTSAEELTVEYLDGMLEIQEDSEWTELDIGDTIPEGSRLRLSDDGLAELSAGRITITLNQDGSYKTEELLEAGKKVASWNIGSVVNSKLKRLIAPDQQAQTAVMGVRGAAQDDEELTWIDEGEQYLQQGREFLLAEDYEAAAATFLEGADFLFDDLERQEYLFYAAYSYAQLGSNAQALSLLEEVVPEADVSYFVDYVLLAGKLLIESLAFEDALNLFDAYLSKPDGGETTQVVYFLSALCLQGLGNHREALKSLETAYEIDKDSIYGIAAQQMMTDLSTP